MKSGDRCLPVSGEWLASALPKRKREHAVPDYAQHTIPRSNPMRIQGAPWPLPPHACRLLDSIKMDSKVKLQSQVKSNSRLGGRGPGAQLPHLPRQRNSQTLCTPRAPHSHAGPGPAAWRSTLLSLGDTREACPGLGSTVSTPLGGRAEPLHKLAILRGARPGPHRKPRAYPLTLEWRFYSVPGHTPGSAHGLGHTL